VDQRWIEWKKLSRHLTLALFSSPSANAKWFAFATPAFRIAKADSTTLRLYDSASIWLYQRHAIGSSAGPRIVIALTRHSLSLSLSPHSGTKLNILTNKVTLPRQMEQQIVVD